MPSPTTRPLRRTATACALAVVCAALPGAAQAAVWSPTADLIPADPTSRADTRPQVAVGPDGTVTVVHAIEVIGGGMAVEARTRPGGATAFGPPQTLSAPGESGYRPEIAAGQDGATTVTWTTGPPAGTLRARTRPPGSDTFGPAVDLAPSRVETSSIAVGRDGTTVVVWQRDSSAFTSVIQARTRPAGSGAFGPTADLSVTDHWATNPDVAVGPDGRATAVWQRYQGAVTLAQAATSGPGGTGWGSRTTLADPTQSAVEPRVATGPDGTTGVVWGLSDGSVGRVQARTRAPAATTFGPVHTLATGASVGNARVGVGPAGATTVLLADSSQGLLVRSTPAGSSVFGPADVLATGVRDAAALAVAPDGAATALYPAADGRVQARTRPAGVAGFGAVAVVSPPGQVASWPDLAVNAGGMLAGTWDRTDITNWTTQAATATPTPSIAVRPVNPADGHKRVAAAPGTATIPVHALWAPSSPGIDTLSVRFSRASLAGPDGALPAAGANAVGHGTLHNAGANKSDWIGSADVTFLAAPGTYSFQFVASGPHPGCDPPGASCTLLSPVYTMTVTRPVVTPPTSHRLTRAEALKVLRRYVQRRLHLKRFAPSCRRVDTYTYDCRVTWRTGSRHRVRFFGVWRDADTGRTSVSIQ